MKEITLFSLLKQIYISKRWARSQKIPETCAFFLGEKLWLIIKIFLKYVFYFLLMFISLHIHIGKQVIYFGLYGKINN